MTRQQFVSVYCIVGSVVGCFAVALITGIILAPLHAIATSIAAFDAARTVFQCAPILCWTGVSIVIVWSGSKGTMWILLAQHQQALNVKARAEGKLMTAEALLKLQMVTVPEGHLALIGSQLQTHERILIPHTPTKVTEVVEAPVALPEKTVPDPFTCEGIVALNDPHSFYFGRHSQGDTLVKIKQAYHMIDASASGKGKSNRYRLLMAQSVKKGCETYFLSPFANPVKAVDDDRKIEVWEPIFARLAERPKKTGEDIFDLCTRLRAELDMRIKQEDQGDTSWTTRPIYVFIDEMPELVKRCPNISAFVDDIGRTGRQFMMFICVASQDIHVGTIKQGTGSQANYRTRLYGGGDATSANRAVGNGIITPDIEKLITAHKGLFMIKADGLPEPLLTRAPLVTNEWLFDYLDFGPFVLSEWTQSRRTFQPQPEYTQKPLWTHTVDVEKQSEYAKDCHLFQLVQPSQLKPGLKASDMKQRPLTQDEIFAVVRALDRLEQEGKDRTLNAIRTRADLNWTTDNAIRTVCQALDKPLVR